MSDKPQADVARSDGHTPSVLAVCISPGGIPKRCVESAEVVWEGLVGDGHAHAKHCRPDRAVSLQDIETLDELAAEGYAVGPGITGENLTVRGLNLRACQPGDRLVFEDGPVLELTMPRKPCYVLDAVHPRLKEVIVGRCGFLARVVRPGRVFVGQRIRVERDAEDTPPTT